jgi:hypothetical protein
MRNVLEMIVETRLGKVLPPFKITSRFSLVLPFYLLSLFSLSPRVSGLQGAENEDQGV